MTLKNVALICACLAMGFHGVAAQEDPQNVLPVRGLCLPLPSPGRVGEFVDFINQELAPRQVNTLILRVEFHYQYQSHPELRDGSALSKEEVKRVVAACKAHHIRIIPELDLLGHQSWGSSLGNLLRQYPEFDETPNVKLPEKYKWPNPDGLYCKSYCPLNPKVHEVIFALMDELCDVFEADTFHAGMDEVFYIGENQCPRCAGHDKGELFAGEVRAIHDHLRKKGRSLWIWGDRLLDGRATGLGMWEASENGTFRAIDSIPKDVVICDWHYDRPDPTAVYFAMKGLGVVTCPWKNPKSAVQQARDMVAFRNNSTPEMKKCFLGMVETVWSGADEFLDECRKDKASENKAKTENWQTFKALFSEMAMPPAAKPEKLSVDFWLTDPDRSILFQRQSAGLISQNAAPNGPVIAIDETQTFQTIDGFGFCLTGGSAMHLMKMNPAARAAVLRELFTTDGTNIGTSYLRVSIGASDLDSRVFSYDDLAEGKTDPDLTHFSLANDRAYLIPALREILAIRPGLKILGSPWSAPTWMKSISDTKGGELKPGCYAAYARYFVKYIQEMGAEGIRIDAITVQNEPLNDGNNPSMLMSAPEQASFIKNHLGPAFEAAKIDTKIILYDHNADRPDYPISILDDPETAKYVDGSAFHLYVGQIDALSQVHEAHPDKNLYFSEQWVGAPGNLKQDLIFHVGELIIGATRNWSRTVVEWNLAADADQNPHTDRGGCDRCLGALTIVGSQVTRNPAYYIIAHAAKFVAPGSVRIASNEVKNLRNVAFQTPDGKKVLIVLNDGGSAQNFTIRCQSEKFASALNPWAVGTFVW